jgi:hypothetical protein
METALLDLDEVDEHRRDGARFGPEHAPQRCEELFVRDLGEIGDAHACL